MAANSRTRNAKARTSTGVRFPPEVHAQLVQAADDRDLSVNFLVVKAVEDLLERLADPNEFWTGLTR